MGQGADRQCQQKTKAGNSFADQDSAKASAARINGRRGPGKAARNPVEVFLCHVCGRWHTGKARLTRQWSAVNELRKG